jgi:hypothetical protein
MSLIGMQDMQLTGQADPARAPVAERLHAGGGGGADPVGVVPVRLVRALGEVDLRTLRPGRAGPEPNPVAPPVTEAFKTISIDAA